MNFQKIHKQKGVTLIEILFGVAVFTLIAIAIGTFSRNLWYYNRAIGNGLDSADAGRTLLKSMTTEIRTASAANTGAYTISQASESSFTFYSDIDDDGTKERVRYFLNGANLQKGVIEPSGNPVTYNSGNEVIKTVATEVTNTTIFEYYDKDYDGSTTPLTSPITIPSVRLVKMTITLDKDINNPPAAMTFSTQVSMRNLKDNL
jgi:Tfp pilus assembly protein PilW